MNNLLIEIGDTLSRLALRAVTAGVCSASLFAAEITVAWDPNTEPDLAGYNVYYTDVTSGGSTQMIDVGNTTSTVVSGLTDGNTYSFYVTAYNTAGLESAPSNQISQILAPANNAPLLINDSFERIEGLSAKVSVAKILANDYDADGDDLTILSVQSPTANGAEVEVAGAWIVYSVSPSFNQTDSFTYTVSDGNGGTAVGTVTVLIRTAEKQSRALTASVSPSGHPMVRSNGIPGQSYVIEAADTILAPVWVPLATVTTQANGIFEFVDNNPPVSGTRFYRAVEP